MKPKIDRVEALEKYLVFVRFTDGTKGTYNLAHLAGKGVFNTWDHEDSFSSVYIDADSGAITWPGEIDIDTYTVYCKLKGISTSHFFQTNATHAANL